MMLGVFVSSIISGQIISRIGRYKIFPDHGHGADDHWHLPCYRRSPSRPRRRTASAYMLVLGAGLGMVMQILVMAVQNAVAYEQLGVATSGTTLFRSIGGTVGAALFGGIFAFTLQGKIDVTLPEAARPVARSRCHCLADRAVALNLSGRCSSMRCTRCFSRPRCWRLLAFLLSFAIKEVPLRTSIANEAGERCVPDAARRDLARGTGAHRRAHDRTREPLARLQNSAARLNIPLEPDEFWLLARIGERTGERQKRRNSPSG